MNEYSQLQLKVKGVVQGVGFRPAIYRLARQADLKGTVQNLGGSVAIILEGSRNKLIEFHQGLATAIPKEAVLDEVTSSWHQPQNYRDFTIIDSRVEDDFGIGIPADLVTCDDCFREFSDPKERRFQYPFTTCTACGPRYTVVEAMPYDRCRTTLREFPLCPECLAEYKLPFDRRFHAESTACPKCGPTLSLYSAAWQPVAGSQADHIANAQGLLAQGGVLGLRGLGGYLLCCDALQRTALQKLRTRKQRPHKPLAVMARNLDLVKEIAEVSAAEEKILTSSVGPIVILTIRPGADFPFDLISPDAQTIGMMLPTTPLHMLLLGLEEKPVFDYLVATSGNAHGEPICNDDLEAKTRLTGLADLYLTHNRDLARVCDDSVYIEFLGEMRVIRRARGVAPAKVEIKEKLSQKVLAMGPDLKNTICFAYDQKAMLSPHIGDLSYLETLKAHRRITSDLPAFIGVQPEVIAVDAHPNYQSTIAGKKLAAELGAALVQVQHHHAHAVSCMTEHGVDEALALVFDGSGYGEDGTIWGGELLHVNKRGFRRLVTFQLSHLLGGEKAILHPARQAITRLLELGYLPTDTIWEELGLELSSVEMLHTLRQMPQKVATSSVGRLFDAVAALLGIARERVSYEGQAAIRLESLAKIALASGVQGSVYPFHITERDAPWTCSSMQVNPMLAGVLTDLREKVSKPEIALKFHFTLAAMGLELVRHGAATTSLKLVALSGGVFQNRLLCNILTSELEKHSYQALLHKILPTNDGGIALGQAVIAGRACTNYQ